MAEPIYRYFLCTDSPLDAAIDAVDKQRKKAHKAVKKFMKEVGATNAYGNSPAEYKFDLQRNVKHGPEWKILKGSRGYYWYVPRKNTPEGKALAERVKALPPFPTLESAIEPNVPGYGHASVLSGMSMYRDYMPLLQPESPGKWLVVIAMLDSEQRVSDKPSKRKIDVKPWMREIKKWEFERLKETGQLPD